MTENHPPYTMNSAPMPIPRKKRRALPWILAGIGLVVVACLIGSVLTIGNAVNETGKAIDAAASAGVVSPTTDTPTVPPRKARATPQTTIGEGQFEAGKHVAVGEYRTAGAKESVMQLCIWSVKNSGGSTDDFGSASETNAPHSVKLTKGDSFESSGCQDWVLQK